MPDSPTKPAIKLMNFKFDHSTRSRLKRIVKERRAGEPDKKKAKRSITMTSVIVGLIQSTPVNWKA